MRRKPSRSRIAMAVAVLTLAAGVAAFVIPLHHAGPYGIPGRGLVGGLICFVIAGVLLWRGAPRALGWVALLASPPVLFIALYGALAELEEVIVLYASDADLRLWVVDHEGAEWLMMPRVKADAHQLDGARLDRMRAGTTRCVVPRLTQDPAAVRRTFDLRQEKYAIQRLAVRLGVFGEGPDSTTASLRLDPCP